VPEEVEEEDPLENVLWLRSTLEPELVNTLFSNELFPVLVAAPVFGFTGALLLL
jgi:hypothetical protein